MRELSPLAATLPHETTPTVELHHANAIMNRHVRSFHTTTPGSLHVPAQGLQNVTSVEK